MMTRIWNGNFPKNGNSLVYVFDTRQKLDIEIEINSTKSEQQVGKLQIPIKSKHSQRTPKNA